MGRSGSFYWTVTVVRDYYQLSGIVYFWYLLKTQTASVIYVSDTLYIQLWKKPQILNLKQHYVEMGIDHLQIN